MHFQHGGSRDERCHLRLGPMCPTSLAAPSSDALWWLICCTPGAVPSTEGLTGSSLFFPSLPPSPEVGSTCTVSGRSTEARCGKAAMQVGRVPALHSCAGGTWLSAMTTSG